MVSVSCVALAMWVAENQPAKYKDATYDCQLLVDLPDGFASSGHYVLFEKSELDAILDKSDLLRYFGDERHQILANELSEFRAFNRKTSSIQIPRTEIHTPLFRRELGVEEPHDGILFCVEHNNGELYTVIRYNNNWMNDRLIKLNGLAGMHSATPAKKN